MSRTPTLEDVARAAGVSTATVSRCLNTPEKVVEDTRTRVLKVVEKLGYAPNFSARALVAKRTQTIGAVIPTMENAFFAEGLQAFQRVLQDRNYMMLVASSGYDPKVEADAIRTLAARGADGLLLIGYDRAPEIYEFLDTQAIPAVVAWVHDANGPVPSVGFDNAAAMEALATRAIEMGHRKIGMVSAFQDGNDRARGRVEGVARALQAAGLPPVHVEEVPYGLIEGGEALDRLLTVKPDVTLVICGSDVLAAGAIRRARERGIAVPEQLSITGFDDLGLAQLVDPALTTVRVPHREMGEAAARTIMALVEGERVLGTALETSLCLRDSLAPPRTPR